MSGPEIRVDPRNPNVPKDLVACVGCGALVPNIEGPTNANLRGSPGCWAIFERVRARGNGDFRYLELQQLSTDTYAVQHAEVSKQGLTQTIAPHLIGLCALMGGLPASIAIRAVHGAVKSRGSFEGLSRPESYGELTILHVQDATTLHDHVRRVREWSASVWKAWSPHHRVIRKWTADAIQRIQPEKIDAIPWKVRITRPANDR